jgi:uncharacterized protein YebE (UPF0316 family)
MSEVLISALIIFALRVVGVTFATLRILTVVRGGKFLAWLFGFLQALTYVLTIGWVFSDLGNWMKLIGYAMGFATGLVVGMLIESRLAFGFTNLQVVSPHRGLEMAQGLREQGYAVTEVSAHGKDGAVEILHCSVMRKYESKIFAAISNLDPEAFITAKNVYRIQHGFWQ